MSEPIFLFEPSRALRSSLTLLAFSLLGMGLFYHHGAPEWMVVAAGVLALLAIIGVWHSAKWCIRMWREFLR